MTKTQIKDLVQEGHIIGLHGLEHEDYGKITSSQIEENIIKSFKILNDLDIKPIHFAYPFGSKNNFTNASNKSIKKYFKYLYTGVRGINIINRFNKEKITIFSREIYYQLIKRILFISQSK